jgi:hypothetical protein
VSLLYLLGISWLQRVACAHLCLHANSHKHPIPHTPQANAIAQDIRRIMRSDTRVMNKLHRRVFVDKITKEDVQIYMSFYLDAANRDAFMAIKQDLMVSFVDCVERNGAKLATPRTVVSGVCVFVMHLCTFVLGLPLCSRWSLCA